MSTVTVLKKFWFFQILVSINKCKSKKTKIKQVTFKTACLRRIKLFNADAIGGVASLGISMYSHKRN